MSKPVEEVVYLEDLVAPTAKPVEDTDTTPSSQGSAKSTDNKSSGPGVAENEKGTSANGLKRQRTLVDMFSAEPSSSKKLKLEKSGGSAGRIKASSSFSTATSASSGSQALNSIPFSLSAYQEALSEQERQLLGLECESMGKSWLKLLKDEIRKPYFIKLKEFLWNQGVKGASDSPASLKIYPAPKNIYSWSNLTPLGRVKVVIIGQDPYHGPGQAHGPSQHVPI
ncbi:hypothetical protein EUX98_g4201 [Antrodiella citrinella]|uniref:Uracil-DNA glycosylase-like domain-containing protein n=1 Tax=Antrodiella citrinella TaxID=2447956 RepID=A0A4S4MUR2_9APHY|nr:hypothetical protein EUX98_g4201 [Antrodiella citrinella]